MDFDEYDYLEKAVENPQPQTSKEIANGGDETAKSEEKESRRSSKHRSREKGDDDDDDNRHSKRSRSGDGPRSRHRSRSRDVERRHRSRSRDGDKDRHRSSKEHRDKGRDKDREREEDREERNGKEKERDKDKDRDRKERERERDKDGERERDRSRRSRSRSERHRSDKDDVDKEKSREKEHRDREKERDPKDDRESRRHKNKKEDKVEPEADPERDQRTVFAYQIALKASERDVYEFFSRAGKVRDVRLIMDRISRRSRGIGYVEFYDAMSVPMAIALSGQPLLGQPVMVKPSEAEKNLVQSTAAGSNGNMGPYSGGARRLYVGNLHVNMTEDDLRKVFEPFGAVELVQLPRDESGSCKGFGFVQFARLEDARNAVNLNGQLEIAGRPIKVSAVTDQAGGEETGQPQNTGDLDDDDGVGLSLNAQSRALLMQKLDRSGITSSGTMASAIPGAASVSSLLPPLPPGSVPAVAGLPGTGLLPGTILPVTIDPIGIPTECLHLKNMFDPKAETEPDFDLDIKEDVQEECSKFGTLKHIFVDKNSAGFVYLRFENVESAMSAQRALHGRWFAGNMITATFMTPQTYEAKFPDAK